MRGTIRNCMKTARLYILDSRRRSQHDRFRQAPVAQRPCHARRSSGDRTRRRRMKAFPPFRLDTVNQCLWRRGDTGQEERILMTPKAYAVLVYLVEHAGRLVTSDELLEAAWSGRGIAPQA